MKKLLCILLMAWLPVFMVTASAMSLQMSLQETHDRADGVQAAHKMSCHDEAGSTSENADQCMSCGFCAIATSFASFNGVSDLHFATLTSVTPAYIDVIFNSNNQDPAFRPPILT